MTDGAAHLKPVQVLVHETTHGLLDRLVKGGPSDLSLFQEGLARLAETKVEMRMSGEVFECTKTLGRESCVRHSSRPDAERMQAFLQSGQRIDPTWMASTTPADQRGFLYDASGVVLHHYERVSPPGALQAALKDLGEAPGPSDTGLAAARFVDALLLQSPNLSREAFLRPGYEAAALPIEEFRGCMGPLVAPGFPFDPAPRTPSGGCPVPPAPTQAERDALTRAPTEPIVTSPTPVTVVSSTPLVKPVSPGDGSSPIGGDGGSEAPGGVVDGPVAVPFPWALALAALAGAALAWKPARRTR